LLNTFEFLRENQAISEFKSIFNKYFCMRSTLYFTLTLTSAFVMLVFEFGLFLTRKLQKSESNLSAQARLNRNAIEKEA